MRILYINGNNDFDALSFEIKNKGKKVSDIIDSIIVNAKNGRTLVEIEVNGEDTVAECEVHEYDISGADVEKFCEFIKDFVLDSDYSKTSNFYLETQIISG